MCRLATPAFLEEPITPSQVERGASQAIEVMSHAPGQSSVRSKSTGSSDNSATACGPLLATRGLHGDQRGRDFGPDLLDLFLTIVEDVVGVPGAAR
jgi:hypothetical protein